MDLRIEDKYKQQDGFVFLTGMQAIVRLVLEKQRADALKGSVNQTYFTGYEGSPLGGLDLELVRNLEILNVEGRTLHQFGINEKTAASAILGTQFAETANIDAFWYGKAHGTMWIPDEIWLANLSGTAENGSMVLFCGEDHRSKSSVSPGSSEGVLRSCNVPTFYPANIEEVIELGLHAVALSRHTGLVTALKLVTPVCDGGSTVELGQVRPSIVLPKRDFPKKFNRIVMAERAVPMQKELVEQKLPIAEQYIRDNKINRIYNEASNSKTGIITTGKSYTDVKQAVEYMGVDVPILHLRAIYPLDIETVRNFASGLKSVYVIEEPGPFVEDGIKSALFNSGVESVLGHLDEYQKPFIPSFGELDPEVLVELLSPRFGLNNPLDKDFVTRDRAELGTPNVTPMSCGGCPYNSFRDLKEKPGGAIGCSSIRATPAYDDGVQYIPTMGAGGSIYSGWAPFNGNKHIFQYLGDGSFFHSGRGAIQSCVQGDVNITFLLLFNGVVALTGGQNPGGARGIPDVVNELLGMGVNRIGIVCADPKLYNMLDEEKIQVFDFSDHGDALDIFKKIEGTSVLILDKECATERGRRQRRSGVSPDQYIMINDEICEGCGDCYTKSEGCAALSPIQTEWGEKTRVLQTNCAQDELCLDGECPSFVIVKPAQGVTFKKRRPEDIGDLPEPILHPTDEVYTIYAVGRGGTGVVTFSHLIAYAALIENKYVYLSNNTGLAQKGGPVEAPIAIGSGKQPSFNRFLPGHVDLFVGFDLLRASEEGNLRYASPNRTRSAINTAVIPTATMNRNPRNFKIPSEESITRGIEQNMLSGNNIYVNTCELAESLFSDTIYSNMILLGAAYQSGAIPLKSESIEKAIQLNAKSVRINIQAFRWGRLVVAEPKMIENELKRHQETGSYDESRESELDLKPEMVKLFEKVSSMGLPLDVYKCVVLRMRELCNYQSVNYANNFIETLEPVWNSDQNFNKSGALTKAASIGLYRLMAYKDEYEVARLSLKKEAVGKIQKMFDGPIDLTYCFHPPALRWIFRRKVYFGPWFRYVLAILQYGKYFRGSLLDVFGKTQFRRSERALILWYQDLLIAVASEVSVGNYEKTVELVGKVDQIRGYEEVKESAAARVKSECSQLLREL